MTAKTGKQHVLSSKVIQVGPSGSASGSRSICNTMLSLVQMEEQAFVCSRMMPDNGMPLLETYPQAPQRKTRCHALLKKQEMHEAGGQTTTPFLSS